MTSEDLANLLAEWAERIRSGDSAEGSIEYGITEDGRLKVVAALRYGNREGQGFVRLVDE